MPGFVTWRPNYHHHSISKESDRLEAGLAVIPSRVLHGNCWASKDDRCIGKIQAPLAQSRLMFWRIKGDLHAIKCTPI